MRERMMVFHGRGAFACLALVLCVVLGAAARAETRAQADADGFDYYVLALSWTPSWCAQTGDARDDARCDAGAGLGWLVHGLWPQHDAGGWPEYCATTAAPPRRDQMAAMTDIMGSAGLARHQWDKHGRCAGVDGAAYFDATRQAFGAVTVPDLFERITRDLRVPADVIEEAFLEVNQRFTPDMMTVSCRDGRVQELRVCLTKTLAPRICDAQLRARACRADGVSLPPLR
ncbi:ribonuclease T2 family protein [Roseicitreum antarcticum]|uniref:Ribonuclease T2 n=1 Tax=Roseicitreum antarcticum TaxID=564137 RepID=A0A1H3A5Q7_9RHOB|nr:ribonuclease T2 [Roseicitreum antarcticum]SDX25082.1 ribonuclease T2 [Roseicitreum antarcticum]